MDFNRTGQARANTNQTPATGAAPAARDHATIGDKLPDMRSSKLFRWSYIALLFSGTLLFVAMLLYIVFGVPTSREAKFINKDEMQAVFVNVNGTNGGQVYFGHITDLNPQFIRLSKVFYIQNQQSQASSDSAYNLVKLGCELHGPEDEMMINRSQVFFWENLKNDSQVAQKAAEFYKQNPNGQKCSNNNSSNSTQQSNATTNEAPSGSSTTQNSTNTGATNTTGTNGATTQNNATNNTTTNNTTKKQ